MAKTDLTAERVRELFNYDPLTGILTQRTRTSRTVKVGDEVGYVSDQGYRIVNIAGPTYRVHRIAWLYMYGRHPEDQIDHINGIRDDNRIQNLRPATRGENMQNQIVAHKNNKTGLLGVHLQRKTGRYVAVIRTNGTARTIGSFDTAEDAHEAYLHAKLKDHPFGKLTPKHKEPPQKRLHRASSSGFTGVEFVQRTGRFRAFFNAGRLKKVHVGYFDTALEASRAREVAKAMFVAGDGK